jgi:hypothetical protein
MHDLKHVDSAECHDAFMFLPHKKPKNGRGGHGDRADRQLLAPGAAFPAASLY